MTVYTDPKRRHDFVLLFDVTDGNPNGDPDGGNLPRTDPETLQGLVTDVALKRKVRNYVEIVAPETDREAELKIFVEHHGVLNNQIRRAYKALNIPVGNPVSEPVKEPDIVATLRELDLPEGFSFTDSEDSDEVDEVDEVNEVDGNGETTTEAEDVVPILHYSGELSDSELKSALDDLGEALDKKTRSFLSKTAKKSGKPVKSRENVEKARNWMCQNFFDVRMFGAVMGTGLNAGQVRGAMQLTFARSIDAILPQDMAITRVAVTKEEEREKLQTIGRKTFIPYGLYQCQGFYSPHLAAQTHVTQADLELFWQALIRMWEFDRSASRGLMAPRGLYIFSHESKLGNAPAHKLFERISTKLKDEGSSPRQFSNYDVAIVPDDDADRPLPAGVTLTRLIEG